jgi:hypothetical protein
VAELADLMRSIGDGAWQATDGVLTVVTPPDDRSVGVLAFTGHTVVSADVAGEWVRNWLPDDDLSAPLRPLFLTTLAAAAGRTPDNLDMVLVAPATGRPNGMELTELAEFLEPLPPRLARALTQRIGVRAWRCPGGLLTLGRGVAGRWEVSIEVEEALRGFGLGRGLFTAARGMLPAGEQVWAQVAPGNAASIRAALAAGYQPVGSEVLLRRGETTFGTFAWFVDQIEADGAGDVGPGEELGSAGMSWEAGATPEDDLAPEGGIGREGGIGADDRIGADDELAPEDGIGREGGIGAEVPRETGVVLGDVPGEDVAWGDGIDAVGVSGVAPDAPADDAQVTTGTGTSTRMAEHDQGGQGTNLATHQALSVSPEPATEQEPGN